MKSADFRRILFRTEHIVNFKHRLELQAKAVSAREQSILERERRLDQRELAIKDAETELAKTTEGVRVQYGDFLKNRSSLEADKVTFERQKYMWEREKAALLQTVQAQRAAVATTASTETPAASRSASGTGGSAGSSAEVKEGTASVMSSEERVVSKMIGGSQEGLVASRSSSNLSATESGE